MTLGRRRGSRESDRKILLSNLKSTKETRFLRSERLWHENYSSFWSSWNNQRLISWLPPLTQGRKKKLKNWSFFLCTYPLVTITFSRFFLWKVKENIQLEKSNLIFFLDILIHHKYLRVLILNDFFTMHIYLQLQIDNFCTVNSPDLKKFRFVEILKLSWMVSEIRTFLFIYF